ncbi:unnamed protein product [Hymenolepis diminuta]|uniref:EF-hand domain-containing protein n=1 Tax=Hymenolepis diminuta TaxID=6216 RepID=A0A0R3SQK2_HYMDI|nr:unnamed protein product [Hymenolepis diminuta]
MEIASLNSYLASNDSECDKSSIIKLLPNKQGSANPSHSSCKSSSALRLKEQQAFSKGEQLAKKLADDQKHTCEQVCGDEIIDYKELVSLMAIPYEDLNENRYQTEIYREAFNRFDVNNDGVIDSGDLKALMGDIGNELRESEIFDMIQEADKNGDGVVDYDEFVELFESPNDRFI